MIREETNYRQLFTKIIHLQTKDQINIQSDLLFSVHILYIPFPLC